jgi:hypothetical protein
MRDPEVEHLHLAGVADHDVVGADVAVHDTQRLAIVVVLAMGVREPGRRLVGDVRGDDRRKGIADVAHGMEQPHQVDALDQLHRQVERAVDLAEVEDLDDVGVIERQRDLGLVDEHPHELALVGEVLADLLDDDALGQTLGDAHVGEVDLGHTALADLLRQHVAAEDLWQLLGHRASITRLSKCVSASQPENANRSCPGPRSGAGSSNSRTTRPSTSQMISLAERVMTK